MDKTKTLIITTPEGIAFPLLIAGPLTRFLAWMIDWLCILVSFAISGQIITVFHLISQDLAVAFMVFLYSFMSLAYAITTEWFWNGQTIGKRLFKLKVMDVQGLRLQFSQVAVRNILRVIDILPFTYMVGGVSSFLSKKGQRIGDIVANTIVIRASEIEQPELDQIQAGKFNSLKKYPHLCARLRQKVSPGLADLSLQALTRRNMMKPDSRINLFKEITEYLKQIVQFPQAAVEGISDEQYVRNVVEVIFQFDKKLKQ